MNRNAGVLYAMPDRQRPRKNRIKAAAILALLVLLLFWFTHSLVFSWMVKEYLAWKCHGAGLVSSTGKIHVRIGQPIRIENFHAERNNTSNTETRLDVRLISISLSSPWEIFFGDGRIVERLTVENFDGKFDLRPKGEASATPAPFTAERAPRLWLPLRLMPKYVNARGLNFQFLTTGQTYQIRNANLGLSEDETGVISIEEISANGETMRQTLAPGKGVTAWKNGALYLADFSLANAFQIENFSADFLRSEGVAFGFDVRAFGGYMRGDWEMKGSNGASSLDGVLTLSQLDLEDVPEFLGMKMILSGLVREGRVTFHGNPRDILKAQASLRIAADKVRWNKRGWDTLAFSANLVDGKIFVPEFTLRQAENRVDLNGEMKFPKRITLAEIKKVDYSVTGSADIKDLTSLGTLLGEPFQNANGLLSVKGTLKGSGSNVSGNLFLKGTNFRYEDALVESAILEAEFAQNEAHVTKLEFRNAKDSLIAHAGFSLRAPHTYWGDVILKTEDLAPYFRPFSAKNNFSAYRGKVDAFWQGDGTLGSHSGVFDIKSTALITEWTQAGISGEFKGSYSPENLYFSKFLLRRNALSLSLQATLAKSGIHLQNILFTGPKEKLLEGAFFAPFNALKLFQGESWQKSFIPDAQIYSRLTSRNLPLQDFVETLGQKWPVMGTLTATLNATGSVNSPQVEAVMDAHEFSMFAPFPVFPVSEVGLLLMTKEGAISLQNTIATKGFQPVRLTATVTPNAKTTEKGKFRLLDPNSTVIATAEFPKTTPALLLPFFPDSQKITGTLSGRLDMAETFSHPQISGKAELRGAVVEFSSESPRLENLEAELSFEKDQALLLRFSGTLAGGPFEITGKAGFKDAANIQYQFQIHGKKVPLPTDSDLRLHANVDLTAEGNRQDGKVRGEIRLVEGQFPKRLEITPLLAPSTTRQETEILPAFSKNGVFSHWALDISVQNDMPLHLEKEAGEIISKLHLTGTLANPVPEGEIILKNLRAYFPSGAFHIPEGRISFNLSSPRIAMLDLRGTAQVANYKISAQALGPLREQKLTVRSEPALSQEALLLLLAKGVSPISPSTVAGNARAQKPRPPLTTPAISPSQNTAPAGDSEILYRFQFVAEPKRP